jgi:hypothetical protein
MALIQGGAAMMASKNPRVMGALGEGVGAGAASFLNTRKQAGDEGYRKRKLDLDAEDLSQRAKDAAARLSELSADRADRLEETRNWHAIQAPILQQRANTQEAGIGVRQQVADAATQRADAYSRRVEAQAAAAVAAISGKNLSPTQAMSEAWKRVNGDQGLIGESLENREKAAQTIANSIMSARGQGAAPATAASNAPKAAAPAAAAPGSDADRKQRGLPVGSQYSPSRRQWRTPDGKIVGP